jgi:hypothetical protein
MKSLVLFLALLSASCSQAYIDRQAAERDHAWCQSMGVTAADYRYQECRTIAARNRQIEAHNATLAGSALLGAGSGIYQSSQPRQPTTCTTIGNIMTCN